MDQVKDAANKAASAVDKGLQSASESAKSTIAQLASSSDQAYESGQAWLEGAKACAHGRPGAVMLLESHVPAPALQATASSYWGMFNQEQDKAFAVLKGASRLRSTAADPGTAAAVAPCDSMAAPSLQVALSTA
jgi:hypothetical protein